MTSPERPRDIACRRPEIGQSRPCRHSCQPTGSGTGTGTGSGTGSGSGTGASTKPVDQTQPSQRPVPPLAPDVDDAAIEALRLFGYHDGPWCDPWSNHTGSGVAGPVCPSDPDRSGCALWTTVSELPGET